MSFHRARPRPAARYTGAMRITGAILLARPALARFASSTAGTVTRWSARCAAVCPGRGGRALRGWLDPSSIVTN